MVFLNAFTTYILPALVLAIIGAFFGVLIAICSKYFYVKTDERVEVITSMLPGYNCGACGSAGCSGHAQNILDGKSQIDQCKPSKKEQIEKIREYYLAHKDDK